LIRVKGLDHILNISTTEFYHYGPLGAIVQGPVIFVDGDELCRPSTAAVVGMVVFSDRSGSICSLESIYKKLDNAGAIALVLFQSLQRPSGMFYYRHQSWNPSAMSKRRLVMVDTFGSRIPLNMFIKRDEYLHVEIGPPHNLEYAKISTSIRWTVGLRVVLPAILFLTAGAALQEMNRQRNHTPRREELRIVAQSICQLLSLSCTINGVLFASGMLTVLDSSCATLLFF
jgi:hypothetical protein